MVVRPGLVVGPGDPSGRFTAWPARLRRLTGAPDDGDVLAPGSPDDLVQTIDVRDLATWIVDLAETSVAGTFDAVAPAVPIAAYLAAVARGCGVAPAGGGSTTTA